MNGTWRRYYIVGISYKLEIIEACERHGIVTCQTRALLQLDPTSSTGKEKIEEWHGMAQIHLARYGEAVAMWVFCK